MLSQTAEATSISPAQQSQRRSDVAVIISFRYISIFLLHFNNLLNFTSFQRRILLFVFVLYALMI
jgi:hypothetical protein